MVWLALPLTVGAALGEAFAGCSGPVRWTAAGLAWTVWFLGLVATYVAHPVGLTTLRLAGPAALVAGVVATVLGRPDAWVALTAVVVAVAGAALALHPVTADRCVDGASYGPEQRVALAVPLPLLLGPLPLAWTVTAAGVVTGPLLLAAGVWIAGSVTTAVGIGAAAAAVRSVHGLSNRVIGLVPAGFVLHDRAALLDPVLFTRDAVDAVGPALAGTTAFDLTLGATGLVIEAHLTAPLDLPIRTGRNDSTMTRCEAVLFSPWRPGRFLAIAASHRLPVG